MHEFYYIGIRKQVDKNSWSHMNFLCLYKYTPTKRKYLVNLKPEWGEIGLPTTTPLLSNRSYLEVIIK